MGDDRHDDHCSSCIIIPARFASSRYPGKALARLKGRNGVERSLIEWSWRAARAVPSAGSVIVATDDRRIFDEVERFGGTALMTPVACANGTERCAAAVEEMSSVPPIIVNFQGDALLTPVSIVESLIEHMRQDETLTVATPSVRCSDETYLQLRADQAAGRVGGTTVVSDRTGRALYFSKALIPYISPSDSEPARLVHLHLGVYAYRPQALAAYMASPPSDLEIAEGLEQLRFLDMGVPVGTLVCDPPEGLMIELNNPSDVPLIEAELLRREV